MTQVLPNGRYLCPLQSRSSVLDRFRDVEVQEEQRNCSRAWAFANLRLLCRRSSAPHDLRHLLAHPRILVLCYDGGVLKRTSVCQIRLSSVRCFSWSSSLLGDWSTQIWRQPMGHLHVRFAQSITHVTGLLTFGRGRENVDRKQLSRIQEFENLLILRAIEDKQHLSHFPRYPSTRARREKVR